MPGKPFASSDTRGKISRITKAKISVTPATSSSATSGRGTCSASSLPRRRTQHDSDDESRHDRQHDLARGVENEARRDCSKDRQRPGRNLPKRDFGMRLVIRRREPSRDAGLPPSFLRFAEPASRRHRRVARGSGHPVARPNPDGRSLGNTWGSILTGGLDNVELRRRIKQTGPNGKSSLGAAINAKYPGSKFDRPALRI